MASAVLVQLDGTHGEGGSALLRTAVILSTLTQQPVQVQNIRCDLKSPGISQEDSNVVVALAETCQATTTGGEVGSTTLGFYPGRQARGLKDQTFGLREQACNALVITQSLLPILCGTGVFSRLRVYGETFGNAATTFDYFANVTLPALKKFGLYAFPDMPEAGFGKRSGGTVDLEVEPSAIQCWDGTKRGELRAMRAIVTTADLGKEVTERAINYLERLSQGAGLPPIYAEARRVKATSPGAHITVWGDYENGFGGGCALGQRGLRVENIAQTAFQRFYEWHQTDTTVDPFLADQILPIAILAEGESTFTTSNLTQRLLTMIWVIKQFLPIHITVKGSEGGKGVVKIRRS